MNPVQQKKAEALREALSLIMDSEVELAFSPADQFYQNHFEQFRSLKSAIVGELEAMEKLD